MQSFMNYCRYHIGDYFTYYTTTRLEDLVYSSLRQQIKTTHLMQCGALYCEVNSEHEKVTALTDCLLRKINMRFYALER